MTFRIVKFLTRSTTQIQVQFSAALDPNIGIPNISITGRIFNVADLTVKSISIENNVLTVNTSEQVPYALYTAIFASTSSQPFQSINGEAIDDGNLNKVDFLGLESANSVRDDMLETIPEVYNVEDDTFARKHLANLADQILKSRVDVREVGNSNYISVPVEDEIVRRGFSPTDRLSNEGAYTVTRVATTQTGASIVAKFSFNQARAQTLLGSDYEYASTQIQSFPSDPVSLRTVNVIDETVSNAEIINNSFDQTVISLSHDNVSQIHSITLRRAVGGSYIYDIPEYGYAIQNNRYDTRHGRTLLTLNSNQFKLSDAAILDGYFHIPSGSDVLTVSYAYIDNGINVDGDTLTVTEVKSKVRELVGAYQISFFLDNFPIVTAADATPTISGVTFLDPNPSSGTPFTTTHPAFANEIAYSETRLPATAGEFSVNYSTGQVFVYGASTSDGTGAVPPVASYSYRKTYLDTIDYSFNSDTDEIAANSTRSLSGQEVKVSYKYEQILAPGVDYLAEAHNEVLSERVQNRLISTFRIATLNTPITNVFDVRNETTGEVYSITRFDDNFITFAGRNAPRLASVVNENANFVRVFNETLYVSDELSNDGTTKVVTIELANNNVLSNTLDSIGTNVNTSVSLSLPNVYEREFFYDNDLQTVAVNVAKLSAIGDYLIDYVNGIIYLKTAATTTDYGEINYSTASIDPIFENILSPDTINYRTNVNADPVLTLDVPSFTTELINVSGMIIAGERFLQSDTNKPILFGTKLSGVAGQRSVGSDIFVALDAVFTSDHADGNHIIRFPDDADRSVTEYISSTSVRVDVPFTDTKRSLTWCLIDFDLTDGDGYNLTTTYNISSIRGVYLVSDVQTLPAASLTNLYDADVDTFSGNVLTFNNSVAQALTPGDALMIDYAIGTIFANYTHVADNILVSYEYGDNSLNFSISDAVNAGDQYYVTYRYGALREALLTNFGALTQIDELASFPIDFDREIYRDAVGGAIQAFVKGPTVDAIKTAVSAVTDVDPTITELSFNEWTLDRDNLYLESGVFTGTATYDDGKFGLGLVVDSNDTFVFPAESYISLREGTFRCWVRAPWRGIDNDATLTFDIGQDGYTASDGYGISTGATLSTSDIYVGANGWNPTVVPFDVNRTDAHPYSPVGRPANFGQAPGFFLWYDEDLNEWFLRAVADPNDRINFTGTITTTGQLYNVRDGYNFTSSLYINEVSDYLTSTTSSLEFNVIVDGYDGDGIDGYVGLDGYHVDAQFILDGYYYQDGVNFTSDDFHYLVDTGEHTAYNRMALYKDGSGYFNFRIYDDSGSKKIGTSRLFNLSTDISSWLAGELHFVAASWRLNSADGIDEMHLFIDGQEVANHFKYGGRPQATDSNLFRTPATEVLTSSAPKTIVGNDDGVSIAGSSQFTSASSDFVAAGIIAGDTFTVLDATADAPISRTVVSVVSSTVLDLSANFLLSLDNINFAVNQLTFDTATLLSSETFAAFKIDSDGYTTELYGLDAEEPDYTVSKSEATNVIHFNNNIEAGDTVYLNTLGLRRGRCRDIVYNYRYDNVLRTNLEPPIDLVDVDIYKMPIKRVAIIDDGYLITGDGYGTGLWQNDGYELDGYFTDLCPPSNQVRGKKLRATLGGTTNIDFSGVNQITFNGKTFSGPVSETLTFTTYGFQDTTYYFTELDSIAATFTGYDTTIAFGSLEVIEKVPLTRIENNGTYAVVGQYQNGEFVLYEYGSGGVEFDIDPCHYLLDYPTRLNISVSGKGDLYIGSDINGANQWDGVIDDVIFLNEMLDDIRVGEIPVSTQRSITQDYNATAAPTVDAQTLMLLHLNESLDNLDTFYTIYDKPYLTSGRSVNDDFGDCAIFYDETPLVIDNGAVVLDTDTGSVEFWISPYIDILNDMDHVRYYVDASATTIEEVVSITSTTLQIGRRAREVFSVRLATDTGDGTNYFVGGSLGLDGKTITLGQKLPGQITRVKVEYNSLNVVGDRLSIYKDGYGELNFEIRASDELFQIRQPIYWSRNTWHRVMATWDLNNADNQDRIRLFVDGQEGGTIVYGTPGLLYGAGTVYGSAAVGTLSADFLTTDINLLDEFSEITVGNSFDQANPGKCRMDNVRFSNIVRTPATVSGSAIDLNYSLNLSAILPVVEDANTTALYDFNKEIAETEFLSNLLAEATPLFLFDVDIVDSFGRITDNQRAQDLLQSIIERLKPAHTNSFIRFLE